MGSGVIRRLLVPTTICLLLVGGVSSCGGAEANQGGGDASGGLKPEDVRPALAGLPYKISLRSVPPPGPDVAAFRGAAEGPHNTTIHFSIGIGSPAFPVQLPGAGTREAVSNGAAGFTFNSDAGLPERFPRKAQWDEAGHIGTVMEEKLCKRATGEPCPI